MDGSKDITHDVQLDETEMFDYIAKHIEVNQGWDEIFVPLQHAFCTGKMKPGNWEEKAHQTMWRAITVKLGTEFTEFSDICPCGECQQDQVEEEPQGADSAGSTEQSSQRKTTGGDTQTADHTDDLLSTYEMVDDFKSVGSSEENPTTHANTATAGPLTSGATSDGVGVEKGSEARVPSDQAKTSNGISGQPSEGSEPNRRTR